MIKVLNESYHAQLMKLAIANDLNSFASYQYVLEYYLNVMKIDSLAIGNVEQEKLTGALLMIVRKRQLIIREIYQPGEWILDALKFIGELSRRYSWNKQATILTKDEQIPSWLEMISMKHQGRTKVVLANTRSNDKDDWLHVLNRTVYDVDALITTVEI